MAKRLSDAAQLAGDLKSSTNIVSVVGHYLELDRSGKNFFGKCPFHNDEEHSLSVDTDEQKFACIICGSAGDAIEFVRKIELRSYNEALSIIAKISKVRLDPYCRDLDIAEQIEDTRLGVMASLADKLHENLMANPAALKHFADRGVSPEALAAFKIGYSPSVEAFEEIVCHSWRGPIEEDEETRKRMFSNTIIFPQFNTKGKVVGFSARENGPSKYINHSDMKQVEPRLYGFSQCRSLMRKTRGSLIIVEGYFDALALYSVGIPAVAVCGRDMSKDQIDTLKENGVDSLRVVFDQTPLGEKGMLRLAIKDSEIKGLDLKFAQVPGSPDSYVIKNGAEAFSAIVDNSICAIESVVQIHHAGKELTPTNNADFLNHIKGYLLKYPRGSYGREIGIQATARVLKMRESAIMDFLEQDESLGDLANPRAELAVLAEFATNPDAFSTMPSVQAEDFSLDKFRRLYTLIEDTYQNSAEVNVELLALAARNNKMDSGVLELIDKLPNIDRSSIDVMYRDLRDKSMRRNAVQLMEKKKKLIADTTMVATDSIGELVKDISNVLSERNNKTSFSSVAAIDKLLEEMERRSSSTSEINGLDAGPDWAHLMGLIDGFRKGRMHVICAASSHGKSLIGSNLATRLSLSENGPKAACLYVSQEMTAGECIERMLAIETGIPHERIARSRFQSKREVDIVAAAAARARDMPIYWMEGQRSVSEIAIQANTLKMQGKLDYIVVDYIQLVNMSEFDSRLPEYEKYSRISKELLKVCQSLDVPLICMAQLNRNALDEEFPVGENIAGAYAIHQDSHVTYGVKKTKTGMLGYLGKNRGGQSQVAFHLHMDKEKATSDLRIYEEQALHDQED